MVPLPVAFWLCIAGGQWQLLKDHGELDLADPGVLSGFLTRGLER
jgi:hypothetical protein